MRSPIQKFGFFCIKVRNATQGLRRGLIKRRLEASLQIQAAFAEMERNLIRQRVKEGILAARARGRKGGRPRIMTVGKLRYAQHLMTDRSRSIPAVCRELGDIPSSTLYLPACRRLAQGTRAKAPRPLAACVAFRTFMQKDPQMLVSATDISNPAHSSKAVLLFALGRPLPGLVVHQPEGPATPLARGSAVSPNTAS